MNLMVFKPEEWGKDLPLQDHRALHIKEVLRLEPGAPLKMGLIGENWGQGRFLGFTRECCLFEWPDRLNRSPQPFPVIILVGTPRPPTARRLLKDLTTLGVSEIHFTSTSLGEKSYLQSSLWTKGEYRENLIEGAQQGETTLLPQVHTHQSLFKAIAILPAGGLRIAAELPKHGHKVLDWPPHPPLPVILALGPERGWIEKERQLLADAGFFTLNLGPRNLRTETAALTATALVLSRYFWI